MIIGFSGYATAGKDTAAKILVDRFGYKRAAFADVLRECLYVLNPLVWQTDTNEQRIQDVADGMGWDKAKLQLDEVRVLLQRMGTEVGRKILGENIWVDTVFNQNADVENLTISDVRFPNELEGIQSRGGIVFRIERPGVGPANTHISEIALDGANFDGVLQNDGTVDDLAAKIGACLH